MPTPPARRGPGPALRVERLEDRTTPSFSPFQNPGGLSIAVGDVFPETTNVAENEIIVGAGPGELPYVRVYSPAGVLEAEFLAYDPSFRGGVNVAVANINLDPQAVGAGAPDFLEIITGTGPGGGPLVRVFNPNNPVQMRQFVAFEPSFRGGVNVAGGQINEATPEDEVVVGAGIGGGPVVRVFNTNGSAFSSFFAYESSFRNGVNVAVGDVINVTAADSGDEIVTGPGEGGSPLLKIFNETGTLQRSFFAFDFQSRNGLVVAVGNTDGAGVLGEEIFAVEQFTPLTNAPRVRAFNGRDAGQIQADFSPYPAGYTRYVNLAVGDVTTSTLLTFPFNLIFNSGDFLAVAGEGPTAQTPFTQFGQTGSAAGNNGP